MKCPLCSGPTRVILKREATRRRLCGRGHRFTTYESVTTSDPQAPPRAPPPASPGGLLAAAWHSPKPN